MAPRFVLLERKVQFVAGGSTGGASEKAAVDIFNPKTTETALQSMKPDTSIFEPPEVSRLTMTQQMSRVPSSGGFISCTDKSLAVLYAGGYRPGCTYTPSSGCYLVYDASTNSISAVPQIPPSYNFSGFGRGAAILSRGGGTFVLAEIGTGKNRQGTLFLWQGSNLKQPQSQWERKLVCLPPQVADDRKFFTYITFSYADSSSICWVDLLKGALVCDLIKASTEEEPEITFVPLPQGWDDDDGMKPRPRPEQFRTMSCVNGVIKFVALVGFYENNFARDNIVLKIWTLSHDQLACKPLAVQDLWACESFRTSNLPKLPPMFPVLSSNEDEVVYLSLKEIERKNTYDEYGQFDGVEVVTKAHHVLRVDVVQKKVLHCTKITQGSLITSYWPTLLASDFSSYIHAWKDHEGKREASMEGTSKKDVSH